MSQHTTHSGAIRGLRACLVLAALLSASAHAGVRCTVSGGPGVAFGTYDQTSPTNAQSTTTITITCTFTGNTTSVTVSSVALNTGHSNSYATRTMYQTVGTNTYLLDYNLYQNSYTSGTIWGSGAGYPAYPAFTITGNRTTPGTQTLTVYGVIPALQDPVPGTYTDTITVTVNY